MCKIHLSTNDDIMNQVLARYLNLTTFLLNWEFSNPSLLSFSTPISFPSNIL